MRPLKKTASILLVLSMIFSMTAAYAYADDTDPSGTAETEMTEEAEPGIRTLADTVAWTRVRASSWEQVKGYIQGELYQSLYLEIVLTDDITAEEQLSNNAGMPQGVRFVGEKDDQGTILTLAEDIGYLLYSFDGSGGIVAMENLTVNCNGNGLFYCAWGSFQELALTDVTIRNAVNPGSGIIRFDAFEDPIPLNMTNVKTEGCTGQLISTGDGMVEAAITDCDLSSTADNADKIYYQCLIFLNASPSTISNSTLSWSDGENGESFTTGIIVTGSANLTVQDSAITGTSGSNGGYLFTVGASTYAGDQNMNMPNGLNLENCTLSNADGSRPVINLQDWYGTVGLGSGVKGEPEILLASNYYGAGSYSDLKLQINDRLTDRIYFDYGVALGGRELTLAVAGDDYTITAKDRRCLQYAGEEEGYLVVLDEKNNQLLFTQGTPADKTELDAEIAAAEELSDEGYTTGSWAALQEALNEAKEVSADGSATQDEVAEATEALIEAVADLTEAADKSALDAEIAEAEALNEKDYTADSWSNMQNVLNAAKEVSADGDATQEDVDAMTRELTDAVNALIETEKIEVDKSSLKSEIAEAETFNKGDYTEDSWADLQTALDAARKVLNDEDADQDAVDQAMADLTRAMAALQTATVTGFMRSSSDGNWYYYVDSVRQSKLNSVVSGTVNGTEGMWYVLNGKAQLDFTGLCNYADANGNWWYVTKGRVDTGHNSVDQNDYGWWYVKNGKVDFSKTGIEQNNYGWWRVVNGQVDFSCNSVEQNDYGWWYLVGGQVQFGYTGVANYANAYGWWYISGGQVDFSKTSIEPNSYGWWRVVGGKVDFSCNSVEQNDYGWWYVVGGKVDFSYTGVANYANAYGWWYISGGKVDFSCTGRASNNYGTWNVVNGKVVF